VLRNWRVGVAKSAETPASAASSPASAIRLFRVPTQLYFERLRAVTLAASTIHRIAEQLASYESFKIRAEMA